MASTKFEIADEDGFIAIVNADQYKGFVDSDWELEQLFTHFVKEMNEQHLIIWQTNNSGGGYWDVEIGQESADYNTFREFTKTIRVTNEVLYLTNYTDLTMAAQFDDEVIPAKPHSGWKFELENGLYAVTVKQLFDPDDFDIEGQTHFEIIYKRVEENAASKADAAYWNTL